MGKTTRLLWSRHSTPISIMCVDANTIERMGKIKGQVVETVMYTVSQNGKVLTITQKGTVNGINYGSVQVFDRQQD